MFKGASLTQWLGFFAGVFILVVFYVLSLPERLHG